MTTKSKKLRCLIVLLAVLSCFGGCIQHNPANGENEESGTLPHFEDATVKEYHKTEVYVYQTEVDEAALVTGLNQRYLLLANKTCVLGEEYVPEDLVSLPRAWTTYPMKLDRRAADALTEMIEEMQAAGIKDAYVTSAYRDYDYQRKKFEDYKAIEMSGISNEAYDVLGYDYIYNKYTVNSRVTLDLEDAERVVLSYSARPGTSEHQTGLCVDFITEAMQGHLTVEFEQSAAYIWLSQNAYRFGFILRYPKTKTEITGYQYEPWHYRFVGREAATDIHLSGVTLEEYLIETAS